MMDDKALLNLLRRVAALKNVEIIRLGTRAPAVLPMRISGKLAAGLAKIEGLWMAVHFNHPRELTPDSLKACRTLVSAGVPILNQTVLLKGVNDDVDILEKLFRMLAAARVKPHYLYHADPVQGTAHFRTGLAKGVRLMRALGRRLSSVALPVFALDLPSGGGKIHISPDSPPSDLKVFTSRDGRKIKYF